ncbi:MAG TPA: DUF4832 domain-containing protein, partial [Chitinophagaceae bacterium]|nr:DUF4832 domain-containing protein [Chitinophagaceae bacterium]
MKNWLCTQMVLCAPLPFIVLNRKLRLLLPRLVSCVLIFSSIGFYTTPAAAQTSPLSFNQIPYSDPDLVAPGRGVEHWFDNSNFNNTTTVQVPAGNVRALDFYYRINWAQLEGATEGSYKWSLFDQLINSAIDNGQKFNFGILPMCEGYAPFGQVNGANLSYPTYIHTKMQAEATPDWIYSGDPCWVPNWNSEAYLSALENLYKAVANHIANGSYKGVPYKNVIGYIDVRGYGNFGEWHTYPWDDGRFTAPVNARATSATLKRIIDAHLKAFPNYQLVLNVAVWMQGASSYMPGDVGAYAANASNAYGKMGWRRDNWGQDFRDDEYYNNPYSYNGMRFDTVIRNRWKYGPIIGEPNTSTSSTPNYGDLPREIRLYHANSFGNGNYFGGSGISSQATKDSIIAASKACGYRLILEAGNMTTTLSGGLPFSISLNWKNVGVAPTYEHWNVTYELRNSSNVAVWTGNSSFQPYLFLPSASAQVVTDNFTLPANISPGTYSMVLVVRDPNGYRKPLPLAIKGRAADGSYLLRTVVVGAANQMPVADAGPDLVTTNSLADLDGSATYDPDGYIASFKWTKIAGPGIYSISSTSAATPSL